MEHTKPEKQYAGACLAEEGKGIGFDQFLQKETPLTLPYHTGGKEGEIYIVCGDMRTIQEFKEAQQCIKHKISPEKWLEDKVRTIFAAGHC